MYFQLYNNCLPVKGFRRSVVCDLQRQRIVYIPNLLFEMLAVVQTDMLTIEELKERYNRNEDEGIDKFFEYLINWDVGYYSNQFDRSKFNIEFDYPSIISNSILDYSLPSKYDIRLGISKLEALGCKNYQIRLFQSIRMEDINDLLTYFNDSIATHIDIVTQYIPELSENILKELNSGFPRLQQLVFYNSPMRRDITINGLRVIYLLDQSLSKQSCGKISPDLFAVNIPHFMESQDHNTCLNRKLSINEDGRVTNCPSLNITYGHIESINLHDILEKTNFKKYWTIKKDSIDICKVCEFRHICTDCRVYVTEPGNVYSKPSKCGYNPYTNEWSKSTPFNIIENELNDN